MSTNQKNTGCPLTLEEVKKIELGILSHIDYLCQKNNLRYSLCGGTLLGAVRHKGFIPWDDDIDVMMPRKDYERLIELLRKDVSHYSVLAPDQSGYYYNFAKVIDTKTLLVEIGYKEIEGMGVYVDLFPFEGLPEDEQQGHKHFAKLLGIREQINTYSAKGFPVFRKNLFLYAKAVIAYSVNKRRSLESLQEEYVALARKYMFDDCESIYMSGGRYAAREIFNKSLLLERVQVDFEGKKFWVLKHYHEYLTQLYGEYMVPPPEEKRVSFHDFEAYTKE